jgi:hypothetical protein
MSCEVAANFRNELVKLGGQVAHNLDAGPDLRLLNAIAAAAGHHRARRRLQTVVNLPYKPVYP